MFIYGLKCPLCEQPIKAGEAVFTTWGVWLRPDDPLAHCCDGGIHWECYAKWPHRRRFAETYFNFWVEGERSDVFWHRAFLDDQMLVTVNPAKPVESAWVVLKSTGSRISVKLSNWETWLDHGDAHAEQPVLADALRQAKTALRAEVATARKLIAHIDVAMKQPVIDAYIAAEAERQRQAREIQQQINPHNAACNRLMAKAERDGLTCPHCGKHSKEYRLSRKAGAKSAVICKMCGWVVDPSLAS